MSFPLIYPNSYKYYIKIINKIVIFISNKTWSMRIWNVKINKNDEFAYIPFPTLKKNTIQFLFGEKKNKI